MAKGKELIRGISASHGIVVGVCRVVNGDIEKKEKLTKGEIMVSDRTTPDDIMYMAKASAFVTNKGGALSHTGIVAREMGIPAVCGTIEATTVLKDGQKVVVDGAEGAVYEYIPGDAPAAKSLSDKMAEMAAKKGVSLPADFLEKMKRRD